MVSTSLAKKMIDWVKEGRRTPEQASAYLTRFCSCGVFNPARAERLLEEARGDRGDAGRIASYSLAVAVRPGLEAAGANSAAQASRTLVLKNFTLIDGNGGTPRPNSALISQDGRITYVGPAAQLKAPSGAAVQDLAGKFVMPGIIDLHVHVAESDGVQQDPSARSRARTSKKTSGCMRAMA
jgi:hypothetical protein